MVRAAITAGGEWLSRLARRPAPAAPERAGRYPNFDLLRVLLAVEVAFVHAWDAVDPDFAWPGFVIAVPAFLAISGFLVLQSYAESGSWRVFIRKRALRVLPALCVALLLCLVLLDVGTTLNSFVLWLTGGLYVPPGDRNVPLWSLAWEELAYGLLALLWMFGAYRRPFWIWLLFALSILIVWAGSGLGAQSRIILFLAPAFLIGNLMFIYREKLLDVSPYVPWLVFYVMIQWRHVPDAALFGGAMLVCFQAFAVVWAGMAGLKLIPWKFPDVSYGIYVYHYPALLFIRQHAEIDSLYGMLALLAAVVLPFSLASWYLVEKPLLRFKTPRRSRVAPR